MSSSKIPKATPRGARQMYIPGSSPEAQNANLRVVVDEMRAHIGQLKKELEAEKGHVKELKREKLSEVKSARDQEQQKASLSLSELRSKLSHEKQKELASLRETLGKQHDQEINRLLKQKQELLARSQSDAQREREMHYIKVKKQVWAEAKEEIKRTFEMDRGKLLAETDELRQSKRKLEEELSDAVAGDRQRAADLRRQWGEHQREMDQLGKDARRDIQRLMEELKSKGRVISELEKELGHKASDSQRLQAEKESLGNLLNLSKMAESWDHRSSSSAGIKDSSLGGSAGYLSGVMNGNNEDDKTLQKKIADLNAALRKLEDRNKQLAEDKADLERKIRTSAESRNTTPLIEKNKRLLRKIKDIELTKKKVDERNKALAEENQKLRTLKENMRCRLERENQSLRKVLSKERQQLQRGPNSRAEGDDANDREEELRKLRVEVQEQFLEIVELKQSALEQEHLQRITHDHTPSRLPVPISRPRSSSLTPIISLDEEVSPRSRSGSFDTSILSPLALSDCEDGLDEDFSDDTVRDGKQTAAGQRIKKLSQQNKELEERCSKLEWTLQDSRDQNELLEFRILELEEEDSATPLASPSTDDENIQRVKSLEDHLLEKDVLLQSLQQEVESQRECVRQMEEANEQRVSDLERTEAHLHTHIQDLEDQLARLQEDIHLGLAERNRERAELEAEVASLREVPKGLEDEKDEIFERLRAAQEYGQSWKEEHDKLLWKLKKKEQSEATFKKQIEKLKSQLLELHEEKNILDGVTSLHKGDNTINEGNNRVTMEDSEDVNVLQQKVEQLELEKGSLEAKLRDVEELVLNSDFASEETLREKIAELEQSNTLLNRQLKQSHASDVDSREAVERAAADARETEKTLHGRIQVLQQSEQSLLNRVTQLEEQDIAWRVQVESLHDRVQDLEQLRKELKGKLDEAEERIEELQVAEKFARDELSASHGTSSFLGESLGLMGELGSLAEEEYVEYEDEYVEYEEEDVQEAAPQSPEDAKVPEFSKGSDRKDYEQEELEKESRITELEKSEMERANVELGDLCQELKNQAFEFADENESLKQKVQELEELQTQIPETVKVLEEAEEEKKALTEMVEKLESEVERLTQEHKDEDEFWTKENERELTIELEAVKENNLELSDKLTDEHKKLQELKRAHEHLKEQLQIIEDQKINIATERHPLYEELHQELEKSRSEKAQMEEQFQMECKELKSMIDALEITKENFEKQLETSEHELCRLEEVSSELHAELEHNIEELEREKQDLLKRLGEALEQKPDSSDSPGSEDILQELKKQETVNQDLLLKLASAEEQCNKLKGQVEVFERQLKERKSELTVARKDSMRNSLEFGDSSRELFDVKKRLKELEDVESQFFDQAEVLVKTVKEKEDLKKQMEDSEEEKEKIITQNDQLKAQNQNLDEFRESIRELEEAKENLEDRLDVEAELLEESLEELQRTKEESKTAKEELCLKTEKLDEAEVRGKEMEERLHHLEEVETENLKLQSLENAEAVVDEGEDLDNMESIATFKQRIEKLTTREVDLQMKIDELEERQAAYEETIAQADHIVFETHQKLSEESELLEAKEQELQEAKDQLESYSKDELSHQLQLLEDTSHELQKKSEQLEVVEEKLKELEISLIEYEEKCQLRKENLQKLEQAEIVMVAKIQSLEKFNQTVSIDAVEPIIEANTAATQESANMSESSVDTKFLTEKIQAMTENEEALQQRVEELQERQAAFEETLAQADIMLTETSQKLHDKIEICGSQENELLELRESVARLGEEHLLLESHLASAEELEKKSQLLEETSRELQMKSDELCKLKEEPEMLTRNLASSDRRFKGTEPFEKEKSGAEDTLYEEESVAYLRKRIVDMTNHEEKLQQRINELEERQTAFQETLAQADVIMTERESGFLDQINELHTSHSDLQEKLRRVSETRKKDPWSQGSDDDDDNEIQEFSVFSPDAKRDDSDEGKREMEEKILQLAGEVEKKKDSEKELQKVIEDYKILEESLKSTNNEMQEELNLSRDKINQLEDALTDGGPDNDLQAQLDELKLGVQSHEEMNQKLREEIDVLKGTICDLQDQLLQAPNEQISQDGFIKPGASKDKDELIKLQIVSDEAEPLQDPDSQDLSPQIFLKQEMERLEQEVCETKKQLESVVTARDYLKADVQEKEATVVRLEKANGGLQDDIDICMAQIEELEQREKSFNRISQEINNVASSSPESESQSERQNVKELQETIVDLKTKLENTEQDNLKLQGDIKMKTENVEKERKDLENTEQLKVRELEKSIEMFKKEMASANSERVKTTNRLTEVVQFNREIKKDLRDLEEVVKILKDDNGHLKQEKELLNQKLSTLGISGEDVVREWLENQENKEVVTQKEDKGVKRKVGDERISCINKGSQTGTLAYIPNECLLATVSIDEFEMTVKEFLEALPLGHSPTDPVLLKEGKNFFVEFNKLFIAKCRTPRARLLRGLTRSLPSVKPQPEKKRKKRNYPSLPGEECSKQEAGGGPVSNLSPLEAASATTKSRMIDEFVSLLWELPWEVPPDVDWDTASIWCPHDELEMDEDSIDASECRQVEAVNEECGKLISLESEAPPLPESIPPESLVSHKRTGSMSSDSLSEDPPQLPAGSPPRRVIRNDSLEVEDEDDKEAVGGLPPPLPATPSPRMPDQQRRLVSSFRSDSLEDHDASEHQGLPPPLPKTSPPKKPNANTGPSDTDKQRSSLGLYSNVYDSHRNIPYQNGHNSATAEPDSDASSTDTLTDHETFLQDEANDKDGPSSRANGTHRPASFDSGLDTVSSITEQEVEAIAAVSLFAGPDHPLRLPKPPGVREGVGTSLAKPSTPMWLKQMMDWQTAEKEKEETDLGRLKTSIDTMEKQLQEKEEVVKELRQSEDGLKKKLRNCGDLRPLKLQLQTKDIDLQDKERQVALLKSEVKQKEREVKQKEREVNSLKTKLEGIKPQQTNIINPTDKTDRSAEVARLKVKLEQSQESLKEKEEQLKAKEEEETRMKEEMETKEKEISSQEEALKKQSEELKNLEATVKELHQNPTQNSDQTDAARPHGTTSHGSSPDSRSHDTRSQDTRSQDTRSQDTRSQDTRSQDTRSQDTRSHDIRSHDSRSHDSRSHNSRSQDTRSHDSRSHELHLASTLDGLTRENEELRSRVQRLASVEDRLEELRRQLADSRHHNQDKGALERKLHMAEDMLREKTSEELRLAEDNAALEDRVRHLEDQKKQRDGIEDDYRCIKEQFDDMEHKMNEAEISVAPLKAKVSYLLEKCKERDAIIQRFAAELEQLRPDRTEQLLSEASDLTAVNLPGEEFNGPLPGSGRGKGAKGGARWGVKDHQLRGGDTRRPRQSIDKFSKSMNDVREDDLSDDDELGRLSATRWCSPLDPLSGNLDDFGLGGEEISLGELMRRTSKSQSRSHLTPSRGSDDVASDLLRSVLDASLSKTKSASRPRRDAYSPSRVKKKATLQSYNGPSHELHDIDTDDRQQDGPLRASSTREPQHDFLDPLNPPSLTQSPLYSSQQQITNRIPHQSSNQNGSINTLIPSSTHSIHSDQTLLHSRNPSHPSLTPSNVTYSTPALTDTTPATIHLPLHPQFGAGHQSLNNLQTQTAMAAPAETSVHRGRSQTSAVRQSNASPEHLTAVMHNGSTYGIINGNSSFLAPAVGSDGHPSGPDVHHSGTQSSTGPRLSDMRRDALTLQHGLHAVQSPLNDSVELNSGRVAQVQTSHVTSHSAKQAPEADLRQGSAAKHPGIAWQAGRSGDGVVGATAQSGASTSGASVHQNGLSSQALHSEFDPRARVNGTSGLNHTGGSHQVADAPAVHSGNGTSVTHPGSETLSWHPVPSAQQIYNESSVAPSHPGASASNLHHGIGSSDPSPGVGGHAGNTASYSVGSSHLPLHPGISTTAMHPGMNNSPGLVSATTGFTTSALTASNQQKFIPSSQQQIPNTSLPKTTSTSHNGSFMTSLSPSGNGQPLSPTGHSPVTPSPRNGHMIPSVATTVTQVPWLPTNNVSSQPQIGSAVANPSQHAAVSNGTASPQQRGIPLHHHNGVRGDDEPDRPGVMHRGPRAHVNGRGDHHLPSQGVLRTPNIAGVPQPPRSLIVSKVIGRHGAVLTWYPPDLDDLGRSNGLEIVGYKIFVDGRQKQLVTNAHLTKALVDGINLRTVQSFGIQTVSATGQTSLVLKTEFEDPGLLSSSWSDSVMTESSVGRGTVTSNGSSVVSEEFQERLFMAVYNYNPIEHSPNHYPTYELAFEEGDIVTVFGAIRADGFYQGKVRGKRGLVPSNFIEEISTLGLHHSTKKHSHSKSHRNGSVDTHHHREGDERRSKERARTPTKMPSKSREDQKRHSSANTSRV